MKKLKSIPLYLFFLILAAVILYPVFLVVMLSFRDSFELRETINPLIGASSDFVKISYLSEFPTFSHFTKLLVYTPEFYLVFWNSFALVGSILALQILIAVPAAWAFTRFRFAGRKLLFNLYVILMLMPFQVMMLSQYLILNDMHLMNTRLSVILPAAFSAFPVFLIYRGFSDIPQDVIDAARIDGAGEWKVLWHIGLPLGKHGILACVVLCFLDYWNMVEQPLAFIKDKAKWPLSLYLPSIDMSQAEMILASSVITLIPAVFIFIIGQDYLEQGIIASALKE